MRLRRRREKGATLLETALVLPLLLMLGLGAAEIGFLVVDYLTVSNAAREGARTGSAAGDYEDSVTGIDADDLIVEAVEQVACNLEYSTLLSVTVYEADADGDPIDPSNLLNRYSGSINCTSGVVGLTCANGCPWAPGERDRKLPDLDYLGVEVEFEHVGVTGIIPLPTVTFTDRAVMRLEPDTRG
jgi:hypothetical protein